MDSNKRLRMNTLSILIITRLYEVEWITSIIYRSICTLFVEYVKMLIFCTAEAIRSYYKKYEFWCTYVVPDTNAFKPFFRYWNFFSHVCFCCTLSYYCCHKQNKHVVSINKINFRILFIRMCIFFITWCHNKSKQFKLSHKQTRVNECLYKFSYIHMYVCVSKH